MIGVFLCGMAFIGRAQIKENEQLIFSAAYNMNGLMATLAQVKMETKKVSTPKNTFLHLKIEGATYIKWDSYFKIRDLYEAYVQPGTLKPTLYKRNVSEGNYTKTEKYVYVQPAGTTIQSTTKRKNGPEKNNTFKIQATTVDIVTALYKMRTIDYSKYQVGQRVSITVVFDEKEIQADIKYMGKETLSVAKLGKQECYKLSIIAKTNVLKGTDTNLIWITTSADHVPVLMKFSIPVGTGELELIDITN